MSIVVERGARTRSGRSGAGSVLSRAFQADPLLSFLIPDPGKRARATPRFMRSILVDARPFDEVWVASDGADIAGVAAWLPPGAYPRGVWRSTTGVLRELPSGHHLGRRFVAGMRLYAAIDKAHAQVAGPHWYLASLGCDPPWQRRGVGSALLEPVLARADGDGVLAYLETSKFDNVAWYGRHGFEVVAEINLRGSPAMWAMHRLPR